jgi:predicted TIM-barrel fold metal-dependent hydrolase
MDELGTDIQVLFPTVFLGPVTAKKEVERALYRSYNRWLADIWQQGGGRLRWAVMAPPRSIDVALEELRFGVDHGACGVFLRGIEADMTPANPYFFPLYEAAQDANVPICIHAAAGNFAIHDVFGEDPGIWRFKVPGINAFHALLMQDVPRRFPTLRWCFVELAAQWVPYTLHDFVRRKEKKGTLVDKRTAMRENRMWVACQSDDDIPYVASYTGPDNLIMGTDYGHSDTSSELEALKHLRNMPEVGPELAAKILGANAKAVYGL